MERPVYRPINPRSLKKGAACRQPSTNAAVKIDTPAIAVMTDFQSVSPVTIRPDASLTQANNLMVANGIRHLFVVNAEAAIVGVITARDTTGERPITLIRERGGKHGDLRVADVMTGFDRLEAVTLADVLHAEVGHILQTLKQRGRQHVMVVESDSVTGADYVRGLFSATHIGRRLGVPIVTFEVANTFAEIEAALAVT